MIVKTNVMICTIGLVMTTSGLTSRSTLVAMTTV
jgi:hypothetical protein